ncbi:LCP family protein [Corynebacterium sanguinis]|uniref:LCP family protein n=1 Tax=Corynebacterium sanguinis TaxID=2594913 RepID=UPI0021A2FAB3|nr:LCP family protein [Corynebacterium sanguinis]MCT1492883.1 LCP family protein [Corynebacterium sanguinis]MCT2248022.1 LCP family protein [Corynebacterium sanguinis]
MRDLSQSGHPAIKGVLAFLSALILVISGAGYFSVGRLGGSLSTSELQLDRGRNVDMLDGAVDILLVGSDSRTDAQGNPLSEEELARLNAGVAEGEINTDTIMVIRIPEDGSSATAVSIPRDTYIHNDEFGNMKINGVYAAHAGRKREELLNAGVSEGASLEQQVARAGQEGLIEAVADLTGVEVDHFAQVGLLGFALLTDAVGGVDVCLNAPVDEPLSGANFPAGEQTLNGAQALSFVRQRHDLPRGDLDRIVRQQVYMASLAQKMLSAGTLANPAKLRELATAAERSVTLDEGWDVVRFAQQMSGLAAGDITFATIPVTSVDGVGDYGESIVTVDVPQVQRFMDEVVAPPAAPEAPAPDSPTSPLSGYNVFALNAGQIEGQAGGVAGWLKEQGVTIADVSNAMPGVYSSSQIVALDPQDPVALALAEMLGGLPVTSNEGLEPSSLIVVVADDYGGPSSSSASIGTSETDSSGAADPTESVGTPGEDFGAAEVAPQIDAGGDGPRCVN